MAFGIIFFLFQKHGKRFAVRICYSYKEAN
jgi:hypothetical protein